MLWVRMCRKERGGVYRAVLSHKAKLLLHYSHLIHHTEMHTSLWNTPKY